MTKNDLATLAAHTLRSPGDAARRILALDLDRPVMWMALALTVVLGSLLFQLSSLLFPVPPTGFPIPALISSPIFYALAMAGGVILTALVLTWAGRALGGQGRFDDMLALLVWLQALRLAAQAILLVLMILVPPFAALATLAVALLSLWIMVSFIDAAHGFGSLGRGAMTLVLAVLGLSLVLSMLLAMFGGLSTGVT